MTGNGKSETLIPRIGAEQKVRQAADAHCCYLISGTSKANIQKWKDGFWSFTCPCGVIDTYPLNGFPEEDTLHSCGNPEHWTVRYINDGTEEEPVDISPTAPQIEGED